MATSIASPVSHRPFVAVAPRHDRGFGGLLTGALTLFATAINGYHPYAEDGGVYLAGVKRLLDPQLYPQTPGFVVEHMRFSLFAPMVAAIVWATHLGLPVVLLLLHLATTWATLYAGWMLATRCFASREARVGAVLLLACWLDLPVAGTALLFMDPYVTARSFSTPCMLLALVGALDMTGWSTGIRRRGLWLAALATAALVHPLMAAYALAATLMLFCLRGDMDRQPGDCPRDERRAWMAWAVDARLQQIGALSLGALAVATALQALAPPESSAYLRVAMTRGYWFPSAWRWYELAGLAAPTAILAAFGIRKRPRDSSAPARLLARTGIAAGAMAWVVAGIFARTGSATHLVARLQPLRLFQVVYLVMILLLGAMLGEVVLRRGPLRWGIALVTLGGTMFAAARGTYPGSNHLELPWIQPRNSWEQAFVWVRENTPADAVFALDADYIAAPGEDAQCFRAIAERSALPDYSKDGGEASITPALANLWITGQAAQRGLSDPATTDAERVARLKPLGVSWVVLRRGAATEFECPYRNDAVSVCRLR